ncbi:hypothetical protein [Stappia sp.]|uniref:hypothetical protein n=1 Tax=Stappia sp. TaxID=1870903 RepID=UPI003A9A0367
MPKTFLRAPAAGAFLLAATALGAPASANPAIEASEAFFAWAKANGATIAEYESLTETAPSDAILRGAKLGWDFAFSFGETDIDIDIRIDSPETRLIGARMEADGVHLDRYEQPGGHEFTFSGGVTEKGRRTPFEITATQYDLVAENYYQPYLQVEEDAARPVSRFVPAIVASLRGRMDRVSVRLMEARSKLPDGGSGTERYENFTITGIANGRMEEQRIEKTVSETAFQPEPGSNGTALTMRQETGLQVVTGTDIKPLLRLLGMLPKDRLTGDAMIESASIDGMTIDAGPLGSGAIGSATANGLHVLSDTPAFDVAALGDKAVLGTLPQDETGLAAIGREALNALEALSLDSFRLDALALSSEAANGAVGTIAVKDASYRGLGEFSIADVSLTTAENSGVFDLAGFTMQDLRLARLASYLDFGLAAARNEPSLAEILSIVPTLGLIEIEGLKVASDDLPAPASLDRYRLAMSDFIQPFPTAIEGLTENAVFPVSLIEEEEARSLFEAMGLDVVRYSDRMRLRWDPDTQVLSADPVSFNIEGGGSIDMVMEIGGIPRIVFESPEQAQMAIATATVNRARITVRDAKLVSAFIAQQAAGSGLSPETLALALADQAANEMGPVKDTPFGQSLHGALKAFLVSPDELVLNVEPANPVPAMQIMGVLATTPNTLPQLLNATVSANPGR